MQADSLHTPLMSLKSAALLALIGMILLTLCVLANLINITVGFMHNVVPAVTLLTSLIKTFASLSVLIFFLAFYRAQS
jgi:hypothetical protein